MTKFTAKMAAFCAVCLAALFSTSTHAGDFDPGMSDAEIEFLIEAGLMDEDELYFDDAPAKPSTTTYSSKTPSTKGVSGLDLGSGR